ncbi:MAG: response regulator transcription factor [Anaerolineales bacterium]|nr:response regulator transcription factor [Anaerolineales bacterium]
MDKISILIVDDHPLFRQGLRNVLAGEADFEVVGEGGNGQEGLELTRKLKPKVILLDINLPEMNGLQVVRQIQTERAPASVIMLTAYHDLEQELHAFRAGSHAYCPKDVTPRHLVQVIHWVAQGHYVVNDRVYDLEGLQAWLEAGVEKAGRPYLNDMREAFSPLSPREMEILQCVTRGMSNKEIAYSLGISHQTVKNHMTAILQKLDVEDRTQAAVYALKHGWVRLEESAANSDAKPSAAK